MAATLVSPALVRAQAADPHEATVRGRSERERIESTSRFATAVDLTERGAVAESVGELLDEAPGLQVRRTGDGFSPQTVTLRGAPGAHVTVALDGVVLNDAASDGVDLSLVPPALFERVDVYRGAVPLRLGVAGLGGALELVTRRPDARANAQLTLAYGSFGARRAAALVSARDARVEALAAVGYRGTDGDFTFYNDRGTPRLPGVITARRNAAADAIDVLARACLRSRDDARGPCALVMAGWREREVPGPGSAQADGPYTTQGRVLARLSWPLRAGAWRGELWAATVQRADLFANVGPTPVLNTERYVARSSHGSLEAGLTGRYTRGRLALEPVVRVRREVFSGSVFAQGDLDASRLSALLGAEAEVRVGPVRVTPGVGAEWMRDAGATGAGARALFSARVGAQWSAHPNLELRANGGYFERAPTLPELLGDRGFLRANAALRPERALNVDAGVVARGAPGRWRLRLEVAAYFRDVRDLIALVQVNRARFQPFNLGAATVRGVEVQGRAQWGEGLQAVVSYAFTDARLGEAAGSIAGLRVPGVPEHDLYASVGGRWGIGPAGVLSASANVSYVSSQYLDEANLESATVPARTLVGASLGYTPAFASWLTVGITANNLLDARTVSRTLLDGSEAVVPVQDFSGYPLPGRVVLGTLTLRAERAR